MSQQAPASPLGTPYARRVKVLGISPRELDQIAAGGAYLTWTFFGIAIGAALTAGAALLSGLELTPVALLMFTGVVVAGVFLALLSLILAVREELRIRDLVREVRRDPERLLADVGVVMHLTAEEPGSDKPPTESPDVSDQQIRRTRPGADPAR